MLKLLITHLKILYLMCMVIDAIVTKATRIFKPPLKPHKETKTRKKSLNSFEMSSMLKIQDLFIVLQ